MNPNGGPWKNDRVTDRGSLRQYAGIVLFAAIWIVVLSVPALRLMLMVQVRGDRLELARGMFDGVKPKPPRLPKLVRRYANDVRVLAKSAVWTESNPRDVVRAYDRLTQRFPHEPWLVANRLRLTTPWFHDDRIAGDLERDSRGSLPQRKRDFTADDLASGIAAAKTGRRLEPHNCFFDWVLAYFLFAGYRDKEALAVLHEAASKSRFDDHIKDDIKATIHVRQLTRPQLPEERFVVLGCEVFPHLAKLRQTARLAIWEGAKCERSGDHAGALQIYSAVARLGCTLRDDGYSVIDSLVGIAIQDFAWSGLNRKLTEDESKRFYSSSTRTQRERLQAGRFAAYASKHGRPDLAQQARREAEMSALCHSQIHQSSKSHYILFPVSRWSYLETHILWWAGVTLLFQLPVTIITWFGLSWFMAHGRIQSEPVRKTDLLCSIVVCVCISGITMAIAIALGADWSNWLLMSDTADSYPKDLTDSLRLLTAITPALLGGVYCACATALCRRREKEKGAANSDTDHRVYYWTSYCLHWYQQSLKAMVITASFGYFALSLASLSPRHKVEQQVNALIEHGDMALIRQRYPKAAPEPSPPSSLSNRDGEE